MLRNRPQISDRQNLLLDELQNCKDELTGQELHRQLLHGPNSMGLTTVYRNLQTLARLGLIRSRHLPTGEVLYAPIERDIHHLTCVDCGKTTRLEGCPVEMVQVPKQAAATFECLYHTLEFFGLCRECLQSKGV